MKNSLHFETGLVLQGGGARGAYQVGALRAISDILDSRQNPFPYISGLSVGAINAASLAATANDFKRSTRKLEALWRSLNTEMIFDTSARAVLATSMSILTALLTGRGGRSSPAALLDNDPLRKLLETEFKRAGVLRSIGKGALKGFSITASSYCGGYAMSFLEGQGEVAGWERARRFGGRAEIDVDHLLASSSLPFIFPAVRIGNEFYGDGALRLLAPLAPSIRMGANRLFVIGARDAHIDKTPEGQEPVSPSFGELGGHALDILFNDNLDADIERLERINRTLSLMPPKLAAASGLKHVEFCILQPSSDLREVAKEFEREMPRSVRLLLRSIGAWRADGRVPSYLLFEPGYIDALITLGYRDAMARAGELRAFLTPPDAR